MKIKIAKDPVGLYNLAYVVGEVVDLPAAQAKEMIESGHAVATTEAVGHDFNGFTFGTNSETADSKKKTEKR